MPTLTRLRVHLADRWPPLAGGAVWAASLLALRPTPFETAWAHLLLLLAPLVLVPLGLRLLAPPAATDFWGRLWRTATLLQFPAALLLGGAYLLAPGPWAAALALPWLALTGVLTLLGLERLARGPRDTPTLCHAAALVYLAVGGFWAVLDRAGERPLDFEPVIVLLTALHFHYAGFALPVLAGLAARTLPGLGPRLAGLGVVAAMPLVATGITATQLGFDPLLECAAAWWMAAAGVLIAWAYLRLAARPAFPPWTRGLWALAAVALAGGMTLAALYGTRAYLPLVWLDIPWMRALHGSANALGLGLAGLLGWTLCDPAARRPGA